MRHAVSQKLPCKSATFVKTADGMGNLYSWGEKPYYSGIERKKDRMFGCIGKIVYLCT